MNNQLTMEEAQKIGGAMHRLKELAQTKILSPQLDAERAGIIKYLERTLVEHCDTLLACWIAVETEYEPLVGSFAALLNRATHVIEKARKSREAAAAAKQESPENVIHLDRKGV